MEAPRCHHGLEASMKTSWSDANPAMRYDGSPLGADGRCVFFEWIDLKPTLLQRNYMAKLKRGRDEAREQLRIKTCLCKEYKDSEEQAWDKVAHTIVLHHELEEKMTALKAKRWWWEKMVTLAVLLLILVIVIVAWAFILSCLG